MSASTTFSAGAASLPANPTTIQDFESAHAAVKPGRDTSGVSNAAALARAAFDTVPVDQSAPLVRLRRSGGAQDRGTRTTPCYYTMKPLNNVPPDADGRVRGADLKGTQAYERLVQSLSKNSRDPGRQPSASEIAQAQAIVDDMKLPLGGTLVTPCHTGHGPADRTVAKVLLPPETTTARKIRRAIPENAGAGMNDSAGPGISRGSQPTIEPVQEPAGAAILGGFVDPCRPIGLWQRVFDAIARFVGIFSHPSTIDDAPSTSDSKHADACPAKQETTDEDIRNYENYLLAWTTSFTRRRRATA